MNFIRYLSILLLSSRLAAQIPGIPPGLPPEILEQMRRAGGAPGMIRPPGPGGGPDEGGRNSNEAAALQELLQVQFDRRPARILNVMAENKALAANQNATNLGPARLKNLVELGDWGGLGAFLRRLPTNQVGQVFLHVVKGLAQGPRDGQPEVFQMVNGMPMPERTQTDIHLRISDVLSLADAKPFELDDADIQALGEVLSKVRQSGASMVGLSDRLKAGSAQLGGVDPQRRLKAARLLMAAGLAAQANDLLPEPGRLSGTNVWMVNEMRVRSLMATPPGPDRAREVSRAWVLNSRILAETASDPSAHAAAFSRQLELLAEIPQAEADAWLRTILAGVSRDALALVSSMVAKSSSFALSSNVEERRSGLVQLHRIVSTMMLSPASATQPWGDVIELLTLGWLREAELTRVRHRPKRPRSQMFDPWGNRIYSGDDEELMMMQRMGNQTSPIPLEALLPTLPSESWIALLSPGIQVRTRAVLADLLAKAEDVAGSLVQIEALHRIDPSAAAAAADAFLAVWAKSHDPNPPMPQNGMHFQQYPGMPQPQGIALTRSRQVRNLRELSAAVVRLRKLAPRLDPAALAKAFVMAHGTAEVFRAEDIRGILGDPEQARPEEFIQVIGAMRSRLAAPWRDMKVQQDARTRRSREEMEAQVHRGYSEITDLLGSFDRAHPDNPEITTLRAATLFDKAEFDYGRKVDLKTYANQRDLAFELFAKAASQQVSRSQPVGSDDATGSAFLYWFNAALGASDLSYLTRQAEADPTQLERIRASLMAPPEPLREILLTSFGSGIQRSLETLKPEFKPRYLKAAFKVLGDHPSAAEVRRLVRHHEDLLEEVQLDVRIDGPSDVGHGEAFGIFVALRYSEALGREGGNFQKYLMNQQQGGFAPNPFGLPPVNYRNDFENHLKATWEKGFEIRSVTFHEPDSMPRPYGRPGWWETPYAYVVAKARDASIDRLPSLRLDLDFMDRLGAVILPIQSQVVLIDARAPTVAPRPIAGGEVIQILDDRAAATVGELGLEIKVTGRGMQPDLGRLLDLSFPGFLVDRKSAVPASVLRLEASEERVAPVTEQSLVLSLKPDPAATLPSVFRFAPVRQQGLTNVLKRYVDADLAEAPPEVPLPALRGAAPVRRFRWPATFALLAVAGAGLAWRFLRNRGAATPMIDRHPLPRHLSPFSLVQYLNRIAADPGLDLSPELRSRLSEDLRTLQVRHFAPSAADGADAGGEARQFEEMARNWSRVTASGRGA
jgi:hypothetical protein